jgi:MFS family permease
MASQPWQMFGAALLTGLGWAATSGAAIDAMVSPWFDRRRAVALSHAVNGSSVGGVVFMPLWVALIGWIGFPGAAGSIGAVMVGVLWIIAGRYLSATPQALDLPPDGLIGAVGHRQGLAPKVGLGALARDRRFVTLSVAFAFGLFAQIGLMSHLITRLAPVFGSGNAAATVCLVTACAVVGRLLLGALLGCVLFGVGVGNSISLPPLIAQREFALADVPRIVALVTAINQLVFAFAPAIFGALREVSGAYVLPFMVAVALQLAAAAVVAIGGEGGKST